MPLSKLDAPPESVMPLPEQPGADVTTDMGPRLPKDLLGRRLLWAGLASALVNAVLWRAASQVVHSHILTPPPPLTFRRIIVPPMPKPKPHKKIVRKIVRPKPKPKPVVKPKVVKPKVVKPKVVKPKVVKPKVVKPKPVIHQNIIRQVVRPTPAAHPHPMIRPRPVPPADHHHILTATGKTPTHQTALPGGHAKVGQPIIPQNTGERNHNDQPPTPHPQPRPEPTPQPEQKPTPQPEPKPQPVPQPTPQPVGPTQDAQPSNQVNPDIPDELKTGDYKSHVRVKVDVQADGSFDVSLITSSGSEEIDQRVLDALKRWRWKPALENGKPVHSTQRFRFNFEVH